MPTLRPFFGYYGGKWRDAIRNYPKPDFDTIVEPFAGAAGYSLRYPDRKVILRDRDPIVASVWNYLIAVSEEEILSIPDIPPDGSVEDLNLVEEARWLVGFWLNRATSRPRRSPSKWMRDGVRPGSFWGQRVRTTIASQLRYVRHWQMTQGDYAATDVSGPATWFVDPPYETAGRHYTFGSQLLDYESLAQWCESLPGQAIVCENHGATWLPFESIGSFNATRTGTRSKEVVWLSDFSQMPLSVMRSRSQIAA